MINQEETQTENSCDLCGIKLPLTRIGICSNCEDALNQNIAMERLHVFNKYAIDGWTEYASALGLQQFSEALEELTLSNQVLPQKIMRVRDFMGREITKARIDEARRCAADVCCYCAGMEIAGVKVSTTIRWAENRWMHTTKRDDISVACAAGPIHERLHRESQKGGNHEKT